MEMIAVCSENQSQYIKTKCGRKVGLLNCSGIWFIWSESRVGKKKRYPHILVTAASSRSFLHPQI
jgi:hypothetical protein